MKFMRLRLHWSCALVMTWSFAHAAFAQSDEAPAPPEGATVSVTMTAPAELLATRDFWVAVTETAHAPPSDHLERLRAPSLREFETNPERSRLSRRLTKGSATAVFGLPPGGYDLWLAGREFVHRTAPDTSLVLSPGQVERVEFNLVQIDATLLDMPIHGTPQIMAEWPASPESQHPRKWWATMTAPADPTATASMAVTVPGPGALRVLMRLEDHPVSSGYWIWWQDLRVTPGARATVVCRFPGRGERGSILSHVNNPHVAFNLKAVGDHVMASVPIDGPSVRLVGLPAGEYRVVAARLPDSIPSSAELDKATKVVVAPGGVARVTLE